MFDEKQLIEEMAEEIDGNELVFIRSDGNLAENAIYFNGYMPDGEPMFFELIGMVNPEINGIKKYKRLLIRRVFPAVEEKNIEKER